MILNVFSELGSFSKKHYWMYFQGYNVEQFCIRSYILSAFFFFFSCAGDQTQDHTCWASALLLSCVPSLSCLLINEKVKYRQEILKPFSYVLLFFGTVLVFELRASCLLSGCCLNYAPNLRCLNGSQWFLPVFQYLICPHHCFEGS
jgi:hypothetical protein